MTFEDWMKAVDTIFAEHFSGFTSDDLPDAPYRDSFNDGLSPRDMVESYVYDQDYTGLMADIWEGESP